MNTGDRMDPWWPTPSREVAAIGDHAGGPVGSGSPPRPGRPTGTTRPPDRRPGRSPSPARTSPATGPLPARRPQRARRAQWARGRAPALRLLSLGAGVQSSALLLLACQGEIPPFDRALFADTGWEPRAVYRNLARLRAHAARAGIVVQTVANGDIRSDALAGDRRFVSMPLHVRNPDGSKGMARRQCTNEYKIVPLKRAARTLLGYPHPHRVPEGVYAEQAIGISTEEFTRARDADVRYLRNIFPLIELGWNREHCLAYLTEQGFGDTVKSACVGCPFHSNAGWRQIHDHDPDAWAAAVEFDRAIRHGHPHATTPLRGQYFLHRSCRPLNQIDLDQPTTTGAAGAAVDTAAGGEPEPPSCSPWSCRASTNPDQP